VHHVIREHLHAVMWLRYSYLTFYSSGNYRNLFNYFLTGNACDVSFTLSATGGALSGYMV